MTTDIKFIDTRKGRFYFRWVGFRVEIVSAPDSLHPRQQSAIVAMRQRDLVGGYHANV